MVDTVQSARIELSYIELSHTELSCDKLSATSCGELSCGELAGASWPGKPDVVCFPILILIIDEAVNLVYLTEPWLGLEWWDHRRTIFESMYFK